MVASEEKLLGVLSHLGILIGLPIILPIIIFLLKKDSDFVRHHAKEAIAFHIMILIISFVSVLLIIVLIGVLFIILTGLFAFIMTIVAIIKTADGEYYRYPLSTHFSEKF